MQQGLGPRGGKLKSFKLETDISLSKGKETIRQIKEGKREEKRRSGTGFVATSCRKS